MPLFSRGRAGLAVSPPLIEDDNERGTPSHPGTSRTLAHLLREALTALERPRLSGGDIALHMVRARYGIRDPRDLEL